MKLVINIDGGSRGNPGPAAAGVVIAEEDGLPIFEGGFHLGRATNNQAEYAALRLAIEKATELGGRELLIRSDSELLVKQINGEYRVRNPDLAEVFNAVIARLRKFERWKVMHVRRELNSRADELANLSLDCGCDVVETESPPPTAGPAKARHAPATHADTHAAPTVHAVCSKSPNADVCRAVCRARAKFDFSTRLPGELCVEAGLSMANAVARLRSGERGPIDVTCRKKGCGARFTLEPSAE